MKDKEKLRDRASDLVNHNLNGLDFLLVTLPDKYTARLEVHFFNEIGLDVVSANRDDESSLFILNGGVRLIANEDFKITEIEEPVGNSVTITIETDEVENGERQVIGDYSTYWLRAGPRLIDYDNLDDPQIIDELFDRIPFKFRPGCFNTQCDPTPRREESSPQPVISYLSKDYDTFKHTMIQAMGERIPGWTPTSEADLDMVLIELVSAAADELSDFQDRVMNEAYLNTSRKRVSLSRHARLMDYHIYQGHKAITWLAIETLGDFLLTPPFEVSTADMFSEITFSTKEDNREFSSVMNRLTLYTWNDVVLSLDAGSTSADLQVVDPVEGEDYEGTYNEIRTLILDKKITHLLIQEWKSPTGLAFEGTGVIGNRQVVTLVADGERTKIRTDPVTNRKFLHVVWREEDKLTGNYFFTRFLKGEKIENISLFHGNLIKVHHGARVTESFVHPSLIITESNQHHYEPTKRWGTILHLQHFPLAYRDVYDGETPNGKIPPDSTLEVKVGSTRWREKITLINSSSNDAHFIVETDENGRSLVRFGNGKNGMALPSEAEVTCEYQVGYPQEGNIGADKLTVPDDYRKPLIAKCWNPIHASIGRVPETREEILRNVPEAFRGLQLRAVTVNDHVDDYEERTQMLHQVSRARASYRWMGSWRLVQIGVDPVGATTISENLHSEILQHLDSVRLIGDQIIIREPKYVPLEIHVPVCVHQDFWLNDVRYFLEDKFSDGITWDGKKAFFHPDNWSFEDSLEKSKLFDAVQSIEGVDHPIDDPNAPDGSLDKLTIKRWNVPEGGEKQEIQSNEIIQVRSNPNQMESGFIYFHLRGGRG